MGCELLLADSDNVALSDSAATKDKLGPGFAFLNDRTIRQRRIETSPIWRKVKSHLPEILDKYRHVPGMSNQRLLEQIELMVLTMEQKARQAMDSIGLSHSQYCTNPAIIEAIANFIASGRPPARSAAAPAQPPSSPAR
jgi:hypothetical protein